MRWWGAILETCGAKQSQEISLLTWPDDFVQESDSQTMWARMAHLMDGVGQTGHPYEKERLDYYVTPYTIINSKLTKDSRLGLNKYIISLTVLAGKTGEKL